MPQAGNARRDETVLSQQPWPESTAKLSPDRYDNGYGATLRRAAVPPEPQPGAAYLSVLPSKMPLAQ